MNVKHLIQNSLTLALLTILSFSCATTGNGTGISLNEAIEQSAGRIVGDIPKGTVIAVSAFETNNDALSKYIIGELNGALVDRGITVVSRQSLEFVEKELNFQMSGAVSDETMQSIGKFFGAEMIIVGELTNTGGTYRYRADTIYVEEARHGSSVRLDVQNNRALQRMIKSLPSQQKATNEIPVQSAPNTALGFLENGILLALRGEYRLAIMNFTDALAIDPELVGAYMLRGRAYFASVADVNAMYENFSGIGVRIGEGAVSQDEFDICLLAVKDFSQAIDLSPNPSRAFYERGGVAIHLGFHEEALEDLNQAIRFNPNFAEAYNGRGIVYAENGVFNNAIADYNQAIRLNASYAAAYYNRGDVYAEQGDLDRAITDYSQAIKIDPNYADAYNNRGTAYARKEDYRRAIADFSQVIKINPNIAFAYVNRGNAYGYVGDFNRAITDFEAALRINPNDAEARKMLEMARQARGR